VHESTIDQKIIFRSPNNAFVLCFIVKTSTVCKIFDEGCTSVSAIGYHRDALNGVDKQCLAFLHLDQIFINA
jgi:hypothetical protein